MTPRYSARLDDVLLARRSDGVFKTRYPHDLAAVLEDWFLWRLDRPRSGTIASFRTLGGDLVIISKAGWVSYYTDHRNDAGRYLATLVNHPIYELRTAPKPHIPLAVTLGDLPPDWATKAYRTDDAFETANWLARLGFTLQPGAQPDELHSFIGTLRGEQAFGYLLRSGEIVVSHGNELIALLDELAGAQP